MQTYLPLKSRTSYAIFFLGGGRSLSPNAAAVCCSQVLAIVGAVLALCFPASGDVWFRSGTQKAAKKKLLGGISLPVAFSKQGVLGEYCFGRP